jgi:hypothetical protein
MTTPICDRCPAEAEWLAYSAYRTGEYLEDGEPGVEHLEADAHEDGYEPPGPHPLVGHYPAPMIRACSDHLCDELVDNMYDPDEDDQWVIVPTDAGRRRTDG